LASRAGVIGAFLLIFMFTVVIGVEYLLYSAGIFAGRLEIGHAIATLSLPALW
jgi:hypothetical protein